MFLLTWHNDGDNFLQYFAASPEGYDFGNEDYPEGFTDDKDDLWCEPFKDGEFEKTLRFLIKDTHDPTAKRKLEEQFEQLIPELMSGKVINTRDYL